MPNFCGCPDFYLLAGGGCPELELCVAELCVAVPIHPSQYIHALRNSGGKPQRFAWCTISRRKPSSGYTWMKRQIQQAELPENVFSMTVCSGNWNGIQVETTEFTLAGHVLHAFPRQGSAILSAVLDEVGGRVEPRLAEERPCPVSHRPHHMVFAPADVGLWGYTDGARYVRDVNLFFELPVLEERLGERVDKELVSTLRLRFFDDRIWTLARLLADACDNYDPGMKLYGDGLSMAIVTLLLQKMPESARVSKGLAPWQLRRAVDFMEAQLPQHVELRELAILTGLSQSHFSRAFKVSTGMAPYQWQLDSRIRRAQLLLLQTKSSLEQIADSTGFTDASHLNRIFRRITGTPPAAWRNARKT